MMKKLDVSMDSADLKFQKDADGVFEGYLSVFGNVDSYGDTVIPGAYKDTLAGRKRMPPMLLNHDPRSVPIGVWQSMKEDDAGLRVVGELTKGNAVAEQVHASLKHGALSGLSIGYKALEYEENDHGGVDLKKIDLREGSIVTMPAEDDARIDVVKLDEEYGDIESIKEFELILRDVGLSRLVAKRLVSQFKQICQRDAGDLQKQIESLTAELNAQRRASDAEQRMARLRKIV